MRKTSLKLRLNRDTLQVLELPQVAAAQGLPTNSCVTCRSCLQTCLFACSGHNSCVC
jgi:hypothetical protein